jgi:nucleoside-diphosphate-sugar epimerase
MRLMIIGGTGAAGSALVRHLGRGEPKADVSVVSRSTTDMPQATRVVTGHFRELIATSDFRGQLAAVDAVVHLADGLSILQQRKHAQDTAAADRLVQDSEQLVQAVRNARVPLFVYVSSIKALADEEDDRILIEPSEPRSTTLYGTSKLRLEERIARIFEKGDTRSVVLRTPVLYGPHAGGSLKRLLALVDTPLPLPLGDLANKRSLLSTENLASALDAVLHSERGGPAGVFHVHDGPPLSTSDIITTLRQALGRPVRLSSAPATVTSWAKQVPQIGPSARRLLGSLELSDDHFRRTFRWQPPTDTKTVLAEMASAYAAEKGREVSWLEMSEPA